MKKVYAILLLITASYYTSAQQIRAVFFNAPGGDNGQEYFEILHTPSTPLTGLSLLIIEGDGSGAGNLDKVIDLSAHSTGTNGLLLWRDAATVLTPAPSTATTVVVNDFAPDIENGSNTYLVVSGFTGTQGTDYDTNNDGVLDTTPWTTVLSAVSVNDGGASDLTYASALGGIDLDNSFGSPHGFVLSNGTYYAVRISGSSPGPYDVVNAWNNMGVSSPAVEATILHPGNTTSPLPILLQSLNGHYNGSIVTLDWKTSQESSNAGFEIQHSMNGTDFTSLDFVKTKAENGSSDKTLHYTYDHLDYQGGTNFYRLLQRDINGLSLLSEVIRVNVSYNNELDLLGLYPNPSQNELKTEIYTPDPTQITLEIFNTLGKVVLSKKLSLEAGTSTPEIDISMLSNGTYLLRMTNSFGRSRTNLFSKE